MGPRLFPPGLLPRAPKPPPNAPPPPSPMPVEGWPNIPVDADVFPNAPPPTPPIEDDPKGVAVTVGIPNMPPPTGAATTAVDPPNGVDEEPNVVVGAPKPELPPKSVVAG